MGRLGRFVWSFLPRPVVRPRQIQLAARNVHRRDAHAHGVADANLAAEAGTDQGAALAVELVLVVLEVADVDEPLDEVLVDLDEQAVLPGGGDDELDDLF